MDTENVSVTLEEALEQRWNQVNQNIRQDQHDADDLARVTGLRHGFQKREHDRIKARQQVEMYKRDEIKLIATRAGIKLTAPAIASRSLAL